MSVGWPNAATSTGSVSVSNVTPIARYSSSVKPPTGFAVSATTTALLVTAATRPVREVGFVQLSLAFALSVIRSPTAGIAAPANDVRAPVVRRPAAYHARASSASGGMSRRSRWRSASSNESSATSAGVAIGARDVVATLDALVPTVDRPTPFVSICVVALGTAEL